MDPVPEFPVDDGLMLAGIGFPLVHGFPDVDPVVDHPVEIALVDRLAALGSNALLGQNRNELGHRTDAGELLEDCAYRAGLGLVDDQLAVADVVAERRPSAHPDALLTRGRELVAKSTTECR